MLRNIINTMLTLAAVIVIAAVSLLVSVLGVIVTFIGYFFSVGFVGLLTICGLTFLIHQGVVEAKRKKKKS